jgi:hypothetical protein
METAKKYENYPVRIVVVSVLSSLILYSMGFLIINRLGLIFSASYLVFILTLEYKLLRYHCTGCYYWGKTCGFGRGRLSSILFKKGDPTKFCNNNFTWKDMIPDLLVSLLPLITGIVLLIIRFDLFLLLAVVVIVFLTTAGNGFIRGSLTCRHCVQAASGCPAYELFNKGN